MGLLNPIIGALAIGSWTNLVLFTVETVEVVKYFSRYQNDHWGLKLTVAMAFVCDIIGSGSGCACVYRYSISHFGDFANLATQGPEYVIYILTTTICAALCQWYLIHRYYRLSQQGLIAGGLLAISLAAKGCALYIDVGFALWQSVEDRTKTATAAKFWLGSEALADVLIAITLIIHLSSYTKSHFADTRSMLWKLILLAAESGTFSTLLAIGSLIAFLCAPLTNICVGIAYNLGRVYTLILLFNLGIRKHAGSDVPGKTLTVGGSFNYPLSTLPAKTTRRGGDEGTHTTDIRVEGEDNLSTRDPVSVQFVIDEKSIEDNNSHSTYKGL